MKQEVYEADGKHFRIFDDELGINFIDALEELKTSFAVEGGKHESYLSKGQLHGPSKYFSKEGKLLSLTWFYQGIRVGKLHRYYTNGQLYCIERYVHGNRHLTQEYFYNNGKKKTILQYQHGKYHGKIQLFWPMGILKRECVFTEGIKTQFDNIYDEKGTLIHGSC